MAHAQKPDWTGPFKIAGASVQSTAGSRGVRMSGSDAGYTMFRGSEKGTGFEPTISAGERPQTAHLLRSWVRIPAGAWIFVCCECRALSGRGLCDELITRPEESYRLCCVVVYDVETSRIGALYVYE